MNYPTPEQIIEQFEACSQQVFSDGHDEILKAEKSIGICSAALLDLREYVNHSVFKNKEEEIRFFKEIKPYVLGEYLYYSMLWEILIRQPITSIRRRKRYLRRMIAETQKFFNDNPEFYLYYRSGSTHLDEKYFSRTEMNCPLNCQHFIFDPYFSTSHDYTLAAIKANEKIAAYCNTEINRLKNRRNNGGIRTDMFWCLDKRDLMQIIYGIYYTDAVNKGDVHIKELVKGFESLFNIRLSGYYHTFYEITQLKKEPLAYLDLMKETLEKLLEESVENKRRKRRSKNNNIKT